MGRAHAEGFHLQRQGLRTVNAASNAGRPLAEGSSGKGREVEDQYLFQGSRSKRQGDRLGSLSRRTATPAGCRQVGRDRLPVSQVVPSLTERLSLHGRPP